MSTKEKPAASPAAGSSSVCPGPGTFAHAIRRWTLLPVQQPCEGRTGPGCYVVSSFGGRLHLVTFDFASGPFECDHFGCWVALHAITPRMTSGPGLLQPG